MSGLMDTLSYGGDYEPNDRDIRELTLWSALATLNDLERRGVFLTGSDLDMVEEIRAVADRLSRSVQ